MRLRRTVGRSDQYSSGDQFIDLLRFQHIFEDLHAVGAERLLFGTDYYSMMPRPLPSVVLDEIAISDGPARQDKAAILAGNVRRVLGLD